MMRAFLRLRASGMMWTSGTPHCHSTTSAALPPWPPGDAAADDAGALARASSSLPPAYYCGETAAALDASRVFRPAWLYAGPAAWVEKPGDYFTIGGKGGGGAVPRAVVARGPDGVLRALSNVCRHRAAPVAARPRGNRLEEMQEEGAAAGAGACAMAWVCGYHGWAYTPEGRLARAPRTGGVERLSARRLSLAPLDVDVLGPLVFVRRRGGGGGEDDDDSGKGGDNDSDGRSPSPRGLDDWLGPEGAAAARAVVSGACASGAAFSSSSSPAPPPPPPPASSASDHLLHVARREWRLACDWKVFADNFLDGGYHVACAHPGLAEGLDLGTYAHALHGPRVSVQTVQSCARAAAAASSSIAGKKQRGGGGGGDGGDNDNNGSSSRLGQRAAYAWVFPNVALNRYGPWLDVNAVVPDGPGRCRVTFDWFLEAGAPGAAAAAAAADALSSSGAPPPSFDEQLRALPEGVAEALLSSCCVQEEDVALCEGVQAGLDEAVACAAGGGGPRVYGSPSVVGGAGGDDAPPMGGGRYARQEAPMYHFHRALWAEYRRRGQ